MIKTFLRISIILILSLQSCRYVQVVSLAGNNTKLEKHLVFENDSVKIIYDIWAHQGILSFSVYNKMNKPLYIDWKKCSYILNNNKKLDYFVDFEKSEQVSYYQGYLYSGLFGVVGPSSVGVGTQTTFKSERITFIPPHSFIGSSKFKLTTGHYKLLNPVLEEVPKSWKSNSKKTTKIKRLDFANQEDSPEKFRNFLTLSTSEKFETEFYIENSFWVSQIFEMKRKQFLGRNRDGGTYLQANRFYTYLNSDPDVY